MFSWKGFFNTRTCMRRIKFGHFTKENNLTLPIWDRWTSLNPMYLSNTTIVLFSNFLLFTFCWILNRCCIQICPQSVGQEQCWADLSFAFFFSLHSYFSQIFQTSPPRINRKFFQKNFKRRNCDRDCDRNFWQRDGSAIYRHTFFANGAIRNLLRNCKILKIAIHNFRNSYVTFEKLDPNFHNLQKRPSAP